MFGSKNEGTSKENAPIAVDTIPTEFYAGANPVVTFKTVKKEIDLGALSKADKEHFDKATAAGSGEPLHPANLLTSRKFLLLAGIGVFALLVVGVSAYYWYDAKRQDQSLPTMPNTPIEPPTTEGEEALPEIPPVVTPPEELAPTTTPVKPPTEASLEFPSRILPDSVDLDSDGLTDREEELFKTDPAVPDSDNDKYADSHEVYNLYNPSGKEPMKIIESGLVKEFTNPVFGYSVYHPVNWAVGAVDQNYRTVLFSTITGENIEIRVIDKENNEQLGDWFAKWAPTENFAELTAFNSVFKEKGWRRGDFLVYFFEDKKRVYTIVYHLTDTTTVNFRTVIKMVARSFRLPANDNTIPLPIIEEGTPTPTSTPTSTR